MSENVITGLGVVGNILLAGAYIPQIHKIIVTKSAEDLSLLMWLAYFIGDVLLLIYSILTGDTIFTALFTLFSIANFTILALTVKYGKTPKA